MFVGVEIGDWERGNFLDDLLAEVLGVFSGGNSEYVGLEIVECSRADKECNDYECVDFEATPIDAGGVGIFGNVGHFAEEFWNEDSENGRCDAENYGSN